MEVCPGASCPLENKVGQPPFYHQHPHPDEFFHEWKSNVNEGKCQSHTVDGNITAPIGTLSHYLHGFLHLSWCKISAINGSQVLQCQMQPEQSLAYKP